MEVIDNDIPTMDAGPADSTSFYKKAIVIKLFLYLILALPLNAYIAFTDHQLIKSYIRSAQDFVSAVI